MPIVRGVLAVCKENLTLETAMQKNKSCGAASVQIDIVH